MRFDLNIFEHCFSSAFHLKILLYLFHNKKPISQRSLSKILGISSSTAQRIFDELGKTGILLSRGVGQVKYWEIANESFLYDILAPALDSLSQIPSPQNYLITLLKKQLTLPDGYSSFLFGSVARLTDTDESDIDFCIMLPSGVKQPSHKVSRQIELLQEECRKKFQKSLNVLYLTANNLHQKKSKRLAEDILLHGIKVHHDKKI